LEGLKEMFKKKKLKRKQEEILSLYLSEEISLREEHLIIHSLDHIQKKPIVFMLIKVLTRNLHFLDRDYFDYYIFLPV
jgi:hypothetical protein